MGDLDPQWTENDIADIWVQLGFRIQGVKVMRDKMGKPTYAFVRFFEAEAVQSALSKNRSPIPGNSGRNFRLNHASQSNHGSGGSGSLGGALGQPQARSKPMGRTSGPEFSLFVGDLGPDVTEEMLYTAFQKKYSAALKQVKIMFDRNGVSKGFGFVRFFEAQAQQNALQEMQGILIGLRNIRLGLANASTEPSVKKMPEQASSVTLAQSHPPLNPFTDPYNTVVNVRGITRNISREDLVAHFGPFGHIIYCRPNYRTNIASIKFLTRKSAELALLFMHGVAINGAHVTLRWGREEVADTDDVVRFKPVGKSRQYTKAQKTPRLYSDLPTNVVFEDMSQQQAGTLPWIDNQFLGTAKAIDAAHLAQKKDRDEYLENAI